MFFETTARSESILTAVGADRGTDWTIAYGAFPSWMNPSDLKWWPSDPPSHASNCYNPVTARKRVTSKVSSGNVTLRKS